MKKLLILMILGSSVLSAPIELGGTIPGCLREILEAGEVVCDECLPGYFLKDSTSNICSKCSIAGCKTCQDLIGNCIACHPDFKLDGKGGCVARGQQDMRVLEANGSLQCSDGYFVTSGTCKSCSSNCKTCSSQQVCETCNFGYLREESNLGNGEKFILCKQGLPLFFLMLAALLLLLALLFLIIALALRHDKRAQVSELNESFQPSIGMKGNESRLNDTQDDNGIKLKQVILKPIVKVSLPPPPPPKKPSVELVSATALPNASKFESTSTNPIANQLELPKPKLPHLLPQPAGKPPVNRSGSIFVPQFVIEEEPDHL